ncbi:MAG: hypothetical protein H6582_04700 [Crocinitomicaceae bacterium]|nr:hypothetical protein [Crocinitomicaceae bacterium]
MKHWTPYLFLVAAVIALCFLLYSLHNRERLGIGITHPRILVEGVLFVVFMAIAISMILKRI